MYKMVVAKTSFAEKAGSRLRLIVEKRIDDGTYKSQAEFARHYGVRTNVFNNWLQGRAVPDVETMAQLCNQEKVTLDWIYRDEVAAFAAFWAEYLRTKKPASQEA